MTPKNIKYIFCISTGRCGTDYLSKLLGTLEGCNSFHEQRPRMHKQEMQDYLKGNKAQIQSMMPQKMDRIHASKEVLYADTSHVFIKSFGWEIPNHISQEEIGIVILRRDIEKVAASTHRTQSGPFNDLGRDWIIYPNGKNLLAPPISAKKYRLMRIMLKMFWKLTGNTGHKKYPVYFKKRSLQLIEWYYHETYALAEKYKRKFPNISFIEMELDTLNTFEGFEKIIATFHLEHLYKRERVKGIIGTPINLKNT